jgi:hypothetical protein
MKLARFTPLLASMAVAQTVPTSTQTYPYVTGSLFTSLSRECVSQITACPPTIRSCAVTICSICTSYGITPSIEPCCAASTPLQCFSSLLAGSPITNTAPAGPTGTPKSADPDVLSCVSWSSVFSTCAAATPTFQQLEFSSMETCLCSTSGSAVPTRYDGFWSGCLGYLSTAFPESYSSLLAPTNGQTPVSTPCADFATNPSAFPSTSLPPTPATGTQGSSAATASKSSSGGMARKGVATNGELVSNVSFPMRTERLILVNPENNLVWDTRVFGCNNNGGNRDLKCYLDGENGGFTMAVMSDDP